MVAGTLLTRLLRRTDTPVRVFKFRRSTPYSLSTPTKKAGKLAVSTPFIRMKRAQNSVMRCQSTCPRTDLVCMRLLHSMRPAMTMPLISRGTGVKNAVSRKNIAINPFML